MSITFPVYIYSHPGIVIACILPLRIEHSLRFSIYIFKNVTVCYMCASFRLFIDEKMLKTYQPSTWIQWNESVLHLGVWFFTYVFETTAVNIYLLTMIVHRATTCVEIIPDQFVSTPKPPTAKSWNIYNKVIVIVVKVLCWVCVCVGADKVKTMLARITTWAT